MDKRLVELAGLLRHHGLRVGPGEVVDAAKALAILGLADRQTTHAALRSCLVKRASDAALFDRIFEMYFAGADEAVQLVGGSLVEELVRSQALADEEKAALRVMVAGASPALAAVLSGDEAALAQVLGGAVLELDLSLLESPIQQGVYSRKLLAAAGAAQAGHELAAMAQALKERGAGPIALELVSRAFAEALQRLEEASRKVVAREIRLRRRGAAGDLADRPFVQLSARELERAAVAVRRLAERLKDRLSRRERSRRGTLHVRRTLRLNLSWGSVPAKLAFRRRRPRRPEVVVLCDVSDSVRNVSRMMLLFVHTLQALFHRVRSFAFVSEIGEVTAAFRAADVRQAVDVALTGRSVNLFANSDYGKALGQFARDHLGAIGRRTTVLVIGDGRTNYHPPNVEALREIRRHARRLVWICPEDRRAWGTGDSAMGHYQAVCDRVAVVQTLADLERAAEQLVP
jgi:uncharacterized protein with von Willebrand factor type A (vWA) domain